MRHADVRTPTCTALAGVMVPTPCRAGSQHHRQHTTHGAGSRSSASTSAMRVSKPAVGPLRSASAGPWCQRALAVPLGATASAQRRRSVVQPSALRRLASLPEAAVQAQASEPVPLGGADSGMEGPGAMPAATLGLEPIVPVAPAASNQEQWANEIEETLKLVQLLPHSGG